MSCDKYLQNRQQHRNIFVLTGKVQSGKTTWLGKLVDASAKLGIPLAGFLSEGHFKDGHRSGFSLLNVSDGTKHMLATIDIQPGWPRFGRFYFNPDALLEGERIIKHSIDNRTGPVILDEVGPMELEGGGWSSILELLEREFEITQLWVVREQILGQVLDRWNIPEDQVFHVSRNEIENTLKRITSHE